MSKYHIFHSVNRWLSPTSGWIKDQVQLFAPERQTILADNLTETASSLSRIITKPHSPLSRWISTDFRDKGIKKQASDKNILFSHFGNRAWLDRTLSVDKRIARFYGYDLHRLPYENPEWKERYLALFELCDLVLTEGPFMKKELIRMGCLGEKVKVLPLGVHVPDKMPERLVTEKPHILIAGAFKEKKGILDALKACQLLFDSGQQLSIQLVGDVINDTERDRKYASEIENFLSNAPSSAHIKWHGFVSRERLMEIATFCQFAILPSKWAHDKDCEGGFPVTFLDLMVMGLPIVSTRHCDIPFAVSNENGALVNEGDIEGIAEAASSLLNDNNLELKAQKAFETVKNRFNWATLKPMYHEAVL